MNKQIKEHLDSANFKFKDVDENGNETELTLSEVMEKLVEDNKKLADYITNLQKENKQLKENKKELIEFLKEYDKYRDSFKWNEQDYIDTIEKIKEILGDKE